MSVKHAHKTEGQQKIPRLVQLHNTRESQGLLEPVACDQKRHILLPAADLRNQCVSISSRCTMTRSLITLNSDGREEAYYMRGILHSIACPIEISEHHL